MFNENLRGVPHFVSKAMAKLIPHGNLFTLRGDDWSTMEWDKNNPDSCPTEAEVATLAEELRVADIYRKPRRKAYPSIGEQLDILFHDMTAGKGSKTGEWYKAIAKVKADNPK